jgi:hypothetical protein
VRGTFPFVGGPEGTGRGQRPWDTGGSDGDVGSYRFGVRFQAKVIQELRSRGPRRLHVPSLVENSVVARLDDPRVKVKIQDILVRCGVSEEDASKVVPVELAPTNARSFNTNASAEQLEIRDVGLTSTPRLVGYLIYGTMHKAIMEIRRMHQSCRPKFRRKARAIEEGTNLHGQGVVIYFRHAVLRRAIRTSRLDDAVELR